MLRSSWGGRAEMFQDATAVLSSSSVFSQRPTQVVPIREGSSSGNNGGDSNQHHAPPLLERSSSWMADYGSIPPVLHRADGRATDNQCIFNMVNALLANGLLGFPYCFKSCGVILTLSITYVAYHINILSTTILLLVSSLCGKRSYEEIAAHYFGFAGRFAVMAFLFFLNLGCLVAYVNILADVLSSVAGSVIPPGAEPSRNILLLAVCVFAVLPVSMSVRTSDQMAAVAMASIAFIAVFTSVIAILAFSPIPHPQAVSYWKTDGLLLSMPMVLCAFTPHTVLFAVFNTMRTSAVRRMQSVVDKSLLGCATIYVIVGIGGYLAFRQRTAGDFLRNLGGTNSSGLRSLYERALRLGYGLAVLGCIPMVMLPLQHTLLPLILPVVAKLPHCSWLTHSVTKVAGSPLKGNVSQENVPPSSPSSLNADGMDVSSPLAMGLTAVLSVLALVFATLLPNVELILALMGSTAAVGVGMILPGAILLRATALHKERLDSLHGSGEGPKICWKWMRRKALAMILVGLLLGFFSTRHLMRAVAEEAEVVELAQRLHEKESVLLQAAEVEQKARSVASSAASSEKALDDSVRHAGEVNSKPSDVVHPSLQHSSMMLHASEDRHEKDGGREFSGNGDAGSNPDADRNQFPAGLEVLSGDQARHTPAPEAAVESSDENLQGFTEPHPEYLDAVDRPSEVPLQVAPNLNNTALAILGALIDRLHKDSNQDSGVQAYSTPEIAKMVQQLDAALDALHHAKNLPNNTQIMHLALSTSIDAIRAVNGTVGTLRDTSDTEVLSVVERVDSVVSQLKLLLDLPTEVESRAYQSDQQIAADDDDDGGTEFADEQEAKPTNASMHQNPQHKTPTNATHASINISVLAEGAVKAAEEATNAALSDIKSAIGKVDPRIASRAEEIAQEMTILEAIDTLAEQNRLDSEKASLGMSIKAAPIDSDDKAFQLEDATPLTRDTRDVVPPVAVTGLGRRGGASASSQAIPFGAEPVEVHDSVAVSQITAAPEFQEGET